jgi:hypothetical protein
MMEDLVDRTPDVVPGMTVFYFTDNSTVYYAVNKGASASTELQKRIVRIKIAELRLGYLLETIHVPGVVMIIEGTNGISRGVWASKHVHEVGVFQPGEFPLSPLQHFPIPVVLL